LTWFVIVELLRVGAAAACVAAALRYSWGDRLYAAWLLFAVNLLLLLIKDVLFGPHSGDFGIHLTPAHARGALVVSGNLATVIAMMLLAGAWRAAGFGELESRSRRVAAQLTTVALAAATTGYALVVNVSALRHGTPGAIEHVASDVGDFVTFSLVAPLAMVTFALRGGALFWPWLLIVLSKIGWMLFDVVLIAHSEHVRPFAELARCLALALMLAAGVAASRAARRARVALA
jgi:hypothetical protein